jgi:hypothetical protein
MFNAYLGIPYSRILGPKPCAFGNRECRGNCAGGDSDCVKLAVFHLSELLKRNGDGDLGLK